MKKIYLTVVAAALLFAGCNFLGMDTPAQRAYWAQLDKDAAAETAATDAETSARTAKLQAETKAAEAAAELLRKGDPTPLNLRMAARRIGFNQEIHLDYENGKLAKRNEYVVGKWDTVSGAHFEFDTGDAHALGISIGKQWPAISLDTEPQFAAFIRDCEAVDQAWKSLK